MTPAVALTALLALLALTWLIGPGGARRCAVALLGNWAACSAFVILTGNFTPWAWFWTMDLLTAAVITMRPVSRWQAWVAYIYMGQLGLHSWFAITGGDPLRYLSWLDGLLIAQMTLVLTWTGGHGLYRLRGAHRRRAFRFGALSRGAHR